MAQGVQVNHPEFEGRARFAQTFGEGVPGVDKHGHGRFGVPCSESRTHLLSLGTHVAGIAASKSFGVAKKSNIVAVKVNTSTVVL